MKEQDVVDTSDEALRRALSETKSKPPQSPALPNFISSQRRLEDALEDDEVREALKARHSLEP